VPDVVAALAIGEGSRVADVGAGSGYFTEHLAREVGAGGRVFAVEISERSLSQLRRLAEDENLDNIEVVPGEVDDPKLPERSLDAVLVVDAYHEMTEYEAMLSGMYRALKPAVTRSADREPRVEHRYSRRGASGGRLRGIRPR
jgi:ubiquinone/menaquinone biosynthesis C-methylase UbiE